MRNELIKFLEWYHNRQDMPIEGDEIKYVDEYLELRQPKVNIHELNELILSNFDEFCRIMYDKFKVRELSPDMFDVDSDDEYISIIIEDDAECVEDIFIFLNKEEGEDKTEVRCTIKGVSFYASYFYDAMD